MAASRAVIGFALSCGFCGENFLLCRKCYRGHSYCSNLCKREGYRKNQRSAQQNYEQTFMAKQRHAARQARYRKRQSEKVTHKSSFELLPTVEQPQAEFHEGDVCRRCGADVSVIINEGATTWERTGRPTRSRGRCNQELCL